MRHLILALAAALLATPPAWARIKLAALPQRERVEIQLDNGRFTLVEEERIVPLLQSTPARNNMIDFAWSNSRVDKDSIQFRPLALRQGGEFRALKDGEIAVVNVSYPPNENALVWEVYAREACALKVRVSYLIDALDRSFSYRALADHDEQFLVLSNHLQIRNYSGESFGAAGVWAGFGPRFHRLVGEQEDIKLLLERFPRVPIRKTFLFDWYANGPLNPDRPYASRVVMHYEIVNGEEQGLGRFPLQAGKVRIFIEDGHGGEAFLGEDWAALTPIDDTMRLYLGEARDVICTRTIEENRRHGVHGNLFHQELVIKYEVENFKDKPVTLDITEQMEQLARQYGTDPHGEVEWTLGERTSGDVRVDVSAGRGRPVLHVDLPARPADPAAKVEKLTFHFHFTIRNLW